MITNQQLIKTVPVLKINNRRLNLEFYCYTLGMKNLLEEGAIVSLGDQTNSEKLVLEESPSMRSRKVEGPKKLAQITLKVVNPQEIEARGAFLGLAQPTGVVIGSAPTQVPRRAAEASHRRDLRACRRTADSFDNRH